MKKRLSFGWLSLCAFLAFVSICAYVGAQQIGSASAGASSVNSADTLQSAVTLLNVGDPQDATNLIATIPDTAPEYPLAQYYRALSLYDLGDYRGFLNRLESGAGQNAPAGKNIREDLDFREISALFACRKFDDLLPKVQAFRAQNPRSSRLSPVAEYQMVALFERGMKKLEEISRSQDTNQVKLHRSSAQDSLTQFLSLSAAFNRGNYSAVTNHTFKEDNWRARIMVGDDVAAFNEISPTNTADRERFSLLRLQLDARLKPLEWEHNFQLRTNFIDKFPNSKNRKRVEFDTVDVSFPLGKRLLAEADAAQNSGDATAAASKRAKAHQYFQTQRSLLSGLTAGKDFGIEDWDLFELHEDLLYGYYLEKDFASISSTAAAMVAGYKPGDPHWMLGRFFSGIVKLNQSPVDKEGAVSAFEDVLAIGFKNKADNDHIVIGAAKWRVRMALSFGDSQKASQLVQWVQESNCNKNIKSEFLSEYAGQAGVQK